MEFSLGRVLQLQLECDPVCSSFLALRHLGGDELK